MSNQPVNIVGVYDPQIDVNHRRDYVVTKGALKNSWQQFSSQTTGSNSFSFNVVPSSRLTYLSRNMYVKATITCNFTATGLNALSTVAYPTNTPYAIANPLSLVQPAYDAPRSFPLSKCINSANLQLGNVNLSMQTGDCIDPLVRVMDLAQFNFNQCPSTPDNLARYEMGSGGLSNTGTTVFATAQSFANNVLGNNTFFMGGGLPPRGVYNMNIQAPVGVAGGPITQQVSFDVFEPVFLSPLCVNNIHNALIGLQNVNVTYNFSPTSQLVWSATPKQQVLTATGALTALPITMTTAFSGAQLWCNFLSPPTYQSIPPTITWNYDEVISFPTGNGIVPVAQVDKAVTVTSTLLQLKCIPQRIIIGCRIPTSGKKFTDPDAYFKISSCAITFANSTGILSTCESEELYNISKKNGLNYDYKSWAGYFDAPLVAGAQNGVPFNGGARGIGSLLVFNPAEDFGLGENLAAGVMGTYNFSVQITATPLDAVNFPYNATPGSGSTNYEMFIITVNDGIFTCEVSGTGATSSKIGLLTEADVLSTSVSPDANYDELKGNGFLSNVKNFIKRAVPIARDIAPSVVDIFNKTKKHLDESGSGLIGSGVGKGVGGKISRLSIKSRLS
jgi:hypothetical protein